MVMDSLILIDEYEYVNVPAVHQSVYTVVLYTCLSIYCTKRFKNNGLSFQFVLFLNNHIATLIHFSKKKKETQSGQAISLQNIVLSIKDVWFETWPRRCWPGTSIQPQTSKIGHEVPKQTSPHRLSRLDPSTSKIGHQVPKQTGPLLILIRPQESCLARHPMRTILTSCCIVVNNQTTYK